MTRLLGLLCLLAPGLVLAQDAEETTAAEIRWLDRTTGRLETHLITVGFPLTLGGLDVHLQACRYPKGQISLDAFALFNIYDSRNTDQLFEGWMVGSSPALNALEHPRYDVWVLRCKTS